MTRWTSNLGVGEHVVFEQVGGEAVLLNIDTGKYYGLDEVGTRMWTLVTQHGTLEPAYRSLLEEYDVDEEQLQHDLLDLVETLVAHGLLQVSEA